MSDNSKSRWWLIDTVEGGPCWVLGKTLNEALVETGTWATGFSYTGHSIPGNATSVPASVPGDDSATKDSGSMQISDEQMKAVEGYVTPENHETKCYHAGTDENGSKGS